MTDLPPFDLERTLATEGPLSREAALAALDHAASLIAATDFRDAARLYQRVIGFDDPAITAAAYVGYGEAMYRLDQDAVALNAWEQATRLPENPSTYLAWRNVAAGRVRAEDLAGARDAYREAERRAPEADRGEIANRLGWLSKELGDSSAAGKYFARARGDMGLSFSVVIIVVTTIISLIAELSGPLGEELKFFFALDKVAIANGELWRLWTVTFVHGGFLHLFFNMYALWIVGPFVEQLYGRWKFLAFYAVFALGASLMTFAFSTAPDSRFAVGASGAIFGLFGMLAIVQWVHKPVVNRNARQLLSQVGGLIAINLVFGFLVPGIDNMAHIGGLITGAWVAFIYPPTRVQMMRSMWLRPGPNGTLEPAFGRDGQRAIRIAGSAGLLVFFAVLYVIGASAWG